MSANLITGNLFSPIQASQDSDYQSGLSGNATRILPVGSQMALTIEDANTIAVADGVIVTKEGRRIQIDNGSIDEFAIPTGTQGTTAYYIVGFHLYTDSSTAAELCETFVEPVESAESTITENTFRGGNTEVYVSLGLVTQNGVNLESVTPLLNVADSIEELSQSVATLNSNLTDLDNQLTASNEVAQITDVPFRFGVDDSGNYGYILTEGGADTVHPFKQEYVVNTSATKTQVKSGNTATIPDFSSGSGTSSGTFTADKTGLYQITSSGTYTSVSHAFTNSSGNCYFVGSLCYAQEGSVLKFRSVAINSNTNGRVTSKLNYINPTA